MALITDHFSGPDSTMGPLCACVCVCSNDIYDADIRHDGSTGQVRIGHDHRSKFTVSPRV